MSATRTYALRSTAASIALAVGATALAHHSTAAFDTASTIELEGAITRYEWANPHVLLWLETRDAEGNAVAWQVEGGPPALLRRGGVTRELIAVGQQVRIAGHPGRTRDRHVALMNSFATGSDEKLAFGQAEAASRIVSGEARAPVPATSLQGVWGSPIDVAAFARFSAGRLELTDKGRQAPAPSSAIGTDNGTCVDGVAPTAMLAPEIKQILIGDDTITIGREWDGVIRTAHMDRSSHEGVEPSVQGHSIGRWEGDTLVIDTARFTPQPSGISARLPSSARKHLVRLRLDADGTHLLYSFVLEDPA